MSASRRARSRRAALEAARRSMGGAWRRGESGSGAGRVLVLGLIAIGLIAVGFALGRWSVTRQSIGGDLRVGMAPVAPGAAVAGDAMDLPPAEESVTSAPLAASALSSAQGSADAQPPIDFPSAAAQAAPVAIVIDDLGRSLEVIDQLRGFDIPLTYSVLPFETKTAAVAARLADLGEEVLCHLPMEAQHGENPGPGALVEAMDSTAIRDATANALAAVPGAVGVNNHMGSALSEDPGAMAAMLDVVRAHGLFFLDSRTSAASVAYGLARDAGIPSAERRVFLDGDRAPEAIRHELARLLALANRGEPAIAIGHPYPETLAVLGEVIPRARAKGYSFVRLSELVGAGAVTPSGPTP